MKYLLEAPFFYLLFQNFAGFFDTRIRIIDEYLNLKLGDRVIDVGCGPGYVVGFLPAGVHYTGFDIDERYIAYAQRHFGDKGTFHCRIFDDACAREVEPADAVMMIGLLHHLDDQGAQAILKTIKTTLKPNGVVLTVDGCFRDGQSSIARWLLKNDRGRHVRTEEGYRNLCRSVFEDVTVTIREDLSRTPYTFAIGLSRKAGAPASHQAA